MNVIERIISEPPGYEQRYSVSLGGVPLHFVRRPVSIRPDEGTICYADNGPRFGGIDRQRVAIFKAGVWLGGNKRPLPFEPTHWTTWEDLTK